MQKSSLPANFTDLALADGVTLVPHPVADARAPNFARREREGARARLRRGQGARAGHRRRLRHRSRHAPRHAGAERPRGGIENGRGARRRPRRASSSSRSKCPTASTAARCASTRGDGFPADDRFYFSIERSDPRPALFVHEPQNARAALYFRTALESATQSAFNLEAVTADRTGGPRAGEVRVRGALRRGLAARLVRKRAQGLRARRRLRAGRGGELRRCFASACR